SQESMPKAARSRRPFTASNVHHIVWLFTVAAPMTMPARFTARAAEDEAPGMGIASGVPLPGHIVAVCVEPLRDEPTTTAPATSSQPEICAPASGGRSTRPVEGDQTNPPVFGRLPVTRPDSSTLVALAKLAP